MTRQPSFHWFPPPHRPSPPLTVQPPPSSSPRFVGFLFRLALPSPHIRAAPSVSLPSARLLPSLCAPTSTLFLCIDPSSACCMCSNPLLGHRPVRPASSASVSPVCPQPIGLSTSQNPFCPWYHTQVWICNVDPSPVWLLDIRVVMQGARAFMLDDDFGLASRASGLPSSLGPFLGGGQHSGQEHGNGVQSALGAAGVMLTQGECYVITVKLNPHSQGEGMLAAAVVATLVRDCEDGAAPPTLFCAGWRATATMVPRGIASKLRPEVRSSLPTTPPSSPSPRSS